ncbi:substrate-binding domain-containing protein [Bifidobacterium subtile]|nr:substrate-binding domain-containing protein [Bifidobacterium subtile]
MSRLVAFLVAAGMMAGLGACSPSNGTTTQVTHTSSPLGSVAVFLPSDGLTVSQHTPLNKWTKLAPELTKSLEDRGFSRDAVTVTTSDSFDRQSRDIQDYVVNTLSATGSSAKKPSASKPSASSQSARQDASNATLIVAPVVQTENADTQYGDYASHSVAWDADSGKSGGSGSSGKSGDADAAAALRQSGDRLVSALKLARESGVHVMVLSNPIQGFTPDVFVQMSTAEQIGSIQARLLVNKLQLDKVSRDNPKSVEVLLPRTAAGDDDQDDFAAEAFSGIWKVLGPYVAAGKVVSPSGSLNAETTAKDWQDSAFVASKPQQVKDELAGRLGMEQRKTSHTRIDGIIAMNDFVASGAMDELDTLQYAGSAADVNPSITISGVLNNMAGKKDLLRSPVPDPAKRPTPSDESDTPQSVEKTNSRWPIITGYGAYLDTIPQVVNGKLWMTALEDRQTLAADVAQACERLSHGQSADKLPFVKATDVNGVKIPTIQEQLLAVSASNLKKTLIDPGYITLAEAGL